MRRTFALQSTQSTKYFMTAQNAVQSILESSECDLTCISKKGRNRRVTVICDPSFTRELLAYYHWGERHPDNFFENTFRIAGQIVTDPKNGDTILIARFLLKVIARERSKTRVVTSSQSILDCMGQAYMLNQCLAQSDFSFLQGFGPLTVIGAGHSHPDLGGIGVSMSGDDVKEHLQCLEYKDMPWLSHIVDPIRGLSAFYYGQQMQTPNIIYCFYPGDAQIFRLQSTFLYRRKACGLVPVREQIPSGQPDRAHPCSAENKNAACPVSAATPPASVQSDVPVPCVASMQPPGRPDDPKATDRLHRYFAAVRKFLQKMIEPS